MGNVIQGAFPAPKDSKAPAPVKAPKSAPAPTVESSEDE